jgi:hypothetical protein
MFRLFTKSPHHYTLQTKKHTIPTQTLWDKATKFMTLLLLIIPKALKFTNMCAAMNHTWIPIIPSWKTMMRWPIKVGKLIFVHRWNRLSWVTFFWYYNNANEYKKILFKNILKLNIQTQITSWKKPYKNNNN